MFHLAGGMEKLTAVCLSESISMVCVGFINFVIFKGVQLYKNVLIFLFPFCSLKTFGNVFFPLDLAISGYEMYTTMRADPCLCFVERCGRPNEQDINAEQQAADPELGEGSVSNIITHVVILQIIW